MKNSSKLIAAASLGLIAGGTLGLLLAPEKGNDTRKIISKKAKGLLKVVNKNLRSEQLNRAKEKLETALQKVNQKMESFSSTSSQLS